jgi:DNA end-binding protein Ku
VCEVEGRELAREIREPGDWAPTAPVTEQELRLAEVLMETLAGVQIDQLRDEYGAALEQLITAQVEGRELPALPEPPVATDLQAALEESIERARGRTR